jgi:predicted negative regulator of RcsB-dependent stress response
LPGSFVNEEFPVDRVTRKSLKTDKFAQEVGHTYEFLTEHSDQVKRYGLVALVLIVLGGAYYFYSRYQAGVRQEELAQALKFDDATVGNTPQPGMLNFATEDEKQKARIKAFSDLAAKRHGTQEGAMAQMYLAAGMVDKGQFAEAEKSYQDVVDSAPSAYASLASVALAKVYAADGKPDQAEKILRKLIDKPTSFVSKEQATIYLAEVVADKKPAEARKLLEPLRASRSSVSRQAITVLGKIPQNAN